MLATVTHAKHPELEHADAAWFETAADRIVEVLSARAATWQGSHMRAEALRQLRRTDVPLQRLDAAVNLLVATATDRSILLAKPDMGINEPEPLRRHDGASVYTVAGSDLYTSTQVIRAEQRLLDLAGRTDGHRLPAEHIAAALQASASNDLELNAGQAELFTAMASSGARVQLAIAPAGAGNTTCRV